MNGAIILSFMQVSHQDYLNKRVANCGKQLRMHTCARSEFEKKIQIKTDAATKLTIARDTFHAVDICSEV